MTTKRKKAEISKAEPTAADIERLNLAATAIRPSMNAAAVITEYGKPFGELGVMELAAVLTEHTKQVSNGDMSRPEAMLMTQAEALQTIFMNFSRRALNQDYQQNLESFFRMALKAQNQCRMTLETLATIKNPPVVFAKQANFANNQQVNNGNAHARENKNQSNELLEAKPYEPMDTGATSQASRTDPAMATVETIHRPKD